MPASERSANNVDPEELAQLRLERDELGATIRQVRNAGVASAGTATRSVSYIPLPQLRKEYNILNDKIAMLEARQRGENPIFGRAR